jgi:electron transport complex protein RnfD
MSAGATAMELRSSPHLQERQGVETIMFNVVLALLPISAFAVFAFGLSALAVLLTTTATCVLTEYVVCRISGKDSTLSDYSVVITGILLGLTLPPGFPLWMAAVGSVVAVIIGKALFGGLGYNVFNPALVGRAFLQAAFPIAITTWTPPFVSGRFTSFVPSTLTFPSHTPSRWTAGSRPPPLTGSVAPRPFPCKNSTTSRREQARLSWG